MCLLAIAVAFGLDFISSPSGRAEANLDFTPAVQQKTERVMVLPASLQFIGEDAFGGIAAEAVLLPTGLETIEEKAFRDMPELKSVYIPETVNQIGRHVFNGSDKLVLIGKAGSQAENWARENHHDFSGSWVLHFRLRAGNSEIRALTDERHFFFAPEKQKEILRLPKQEERTDRSEEDRVKKKENRAELNYLVGLFP